MMRGKCCPYFFYLLFLLFFSGAGSAYAQTESTDDIKFNSWLAKRPLISRIEIDGNTYFSDSKIKSRLFAREHSFWESLKTGSRDRVLRYTANRDTLEVKYLYVRDGFLNVKVAESYEMNAKDSSAIVKIAIEEGSRFLVGRVYLDANDSLQFINHLRDIVGQLKTGDPVDPIIISKIIFDLKTVFANNGYPYADVSRTIDSSAGVSSAQLDFTADEGPLVHFGKLELGNLQYYHPSIVDREITFKEGELYSRKKIIASQKRLYETNLFNTISLDIDRRHLPPGGAGTLDTVPNFLFSAIERKPHFISVKTGAGQDPQQDLIWDFTTSWGKRNFLRSRRFEFLVNSRYIIFTQWRPLSHRFQVRATEPWFFNLRLPLTLTARFEPGVKSQIQPAQIQRWALGLSTRKEWSEELFANISFEYENVNIYGVSRSEVADIRDTVRARTKLTVSVIRDTRLDKFVPKNGSYTTYYAQYVGGFLGGDDGFLKLEFSWARYQAAIKSSIYATRIKTGWVKESGDPTSVPTIDRFYLGGANSIRGFAENSIGPVIFTVDPNDSTKIDTTNVGANAYVIFNQELRIPLFWKLWCSVFTDMGNGWGGFGDFRLENLLFSYGAGIQVLSPAGPIRLDYAHHLENGIYREDHRFHITILYAF